MLPTQSVPGAAAELLRRWLAYHDTMTRSEPMSCIARDTRQWLQDQDPAGAQGSPAAAPSQLPEWRDGMPGNLLAASLDALEWLLLLERATDAGRWQFGQPDSRAKLAGCREALTAHIRQALADAKPLTRDSDRATPGGEA